jgi:sulfatase maturation enzyme AslB (radical SAM superfamily)
MIIINIFLKYIKLHCFKKGVFMKKLFYILITFATCTVIHVKSVSNPKQIADTIARYDKLTQIMPIVAQKVQEHSLEDARTLWQIYNFQLQSIGNLIQDYKNHQGEFENKALANDIFTSYIPNIVAALTKTESIVLFYLEGMPEMHKKSNNSQVIEQSWRRASPNAP